MANLYVPKWDPKDPDDAVPKRFDAAGRLAKLGNPVVTNADVFVDSTGFVLPDGTICSTDGLLVVTDVYFDPSTGFITFMLSGGTNNATYLVTCRLNFGSSGQIDQSASIRIGTR